MIFSQSSSEIIFTDSVGNTLNEILSKHNGKAFLLTDSNTLNYCYPKIEENVNDSIPCLTLEPGEKNKNISSAMLIWEFLIQHHADRNSLLINLGGGVLCDLGGFAASTFKRGIDFIHIPTTLLSQVDASVGGKTGINFNRLKNEIGCFSFPQKVIIDTAFIETLDFENILSGYAEMIKHAFISDQYYLKKLQTFSFSSDRIDYKTLLEMVRLSVRFKEKIVLADPLESGIRKMLNFGHTMGHAFESYYMGKPGEISHGRAVAYGMAIELYLSHVKLGFSKDKLLESLNFIEKIYGKLSFDESDYQAFFELMAHDKKNIASQVNFTLLNDIGTANIDQTAGWDEITAALEFYRSNSFI